MGLLTRREKPPVAVTSRLTGTERVIAWATLSAAEGLEADAVVATNYGLWVPDADDQGELRRIGWHEISKATWRDPILTVIPTQITDELLLVDELPRHYRVETPRDLPEKLRARVEASVVYSEVASVDGGRVRFVGRRVPGRDGVSWWARLEDGAPDTPEVRSAITLRLERLAASRSGAN